MFLIKSSKLQTFFHQERNMKWHDPCLVNCANTYVQFPKVSYVAMYKTFTLTKGSLKLLYSNSCKPLNMPIHLPYMEFDHQFDSSIVLQSSRQHMNMVYVGFLLHFIIFRIHGGNIEIHSVQSESNNIPFSPSVRELLHYPSIGLSIHTQFLHLVIDRNSTI